MLSTVIQTSQTDEKCQFDSFQKNALALQHKQKTRAVHYSDV